MAAFNDYGVLNRELADVVAAVTNTAWIKIQLHLDKLSPVEIRALEQCIQGTLSVRFAETRLMRAVMKREGEKDGANGRTGDGGAHPR